MKVAALSCKTTEGKTRKKKLQRVVNMAAAKETGMDATGAEEGEEITLKAEGRKPLAPGHTTSYWKQLLTKAFYGLFTLWMHDMNPKDIGNLPSARLDSIHNIQTSDIYKTPLKRFKQYNGI